MQRSWKALGPALISFTAGTGCRDEIQAGEQHLLFLVRAPDSSLATDRCMGNALVQAKAGAINWLTKQTGTLAPQVRRP